MAKNMKAESEEVALYIGQPFLSRRKRRKEAVGQIETLEGVGVSDASGQPVAWESNRDEAKSKFPGIVMLRGTELPRGTFQLKKKLFEGAI